jgi:hypothetical protein
VLVGGFAASDWLFTKLYELLTPLGVNIVRPENHVWVFLKIKTTLPFKKKFFRNKAVSDGAISSYLDHFVRTRVSIFYLYTRLWRKTCRKAGESVSNLKHSGHLNTLAIRNNARSESVTNPAIRAHFCCLAFLSPLCFPNMSTRAIYRGPRRKLVLAFDVGTTYSGISYR